MFDLNVFVLFIKSSINTLKCLKNDRKFIFFLICDKKINLKFEHAHWLKIFFFDKNDIVDTLKIEVLYVLSKTLIIFTLYGPYKLLIIFSCKTINLQEISLFPGVRFFQSKVFVVGIYLVNFSFKKFLCLNILKYK